MMPMKKAGRSRKKIRPGARQAEGEPFQFTSFDQVAERNRKLARP
jgi:hypothetical protein